MDAFLLGDEEQAARARVVAVDAVTITGYPYLAGAEFGHLLTGDGLGVEPHPQEPLFGLGHRERAAVLE